MSRVVSRLAAVARLRLLLEVSLWIRLTAAVGVVLPLLAILRLLALYHGWCGRHIASHLDRLVDWPVIRHLVPFVSLYALTWLPLQVHLSSLPYGLGLALWVCLGLVAVEAYSSGLYLRAMHTGDTEVPPGTIWRSTWRPRRTEDIRLHRLLEVHLIYVVPAAVSAALITWSVGVVPAAVAALFLVRYYAYSTDYADFEACVHWHMHTHSLAIPDRPVVSKVIGVVLDYVVGPPNGYVPRLYEIEHLRLHHRYDGGPGDLYSPVRYRRSSFVEFCWFATHVMLSTALGWDLVFNRLLRLKARLTVLANVVLLWGMTAALVGTGRFLGVYLATVVVLHGIRQARAQYEWHGLTDGGNPTKPLGNTMLWVGDPGAWRSLAACEADTEVAGRETALVAGPSPEWMYFDNFHLIHHLHPSAHFTDYLRLLKRRAQQIVEAQAVVMRLSAMPQVAFHMWSGNIAELAAALVTEPYDVSKSDYLARRLEPVAAVRHPQAGFFESRAVCFVNQWSLLVLRLLTGGR
jgi:Fatty acid desaturase